MWAVVDNIVSFGELVPFGPPAGCSVRFGTVVRMASKKMNVVLSRGSGVSAGGNVLALFEVD